MVVVAVLGVGNLGGNIVGELAFNCHTVRAWDNNQEILDKIYWRIEHEKENLKADSLMQQSDFLVVKTKKIDRSISVHSKSILSFLSGKCVLL